MDIAAFAITIVAGYLGASILGAWLNWPDAGSVVAIATMGCIILNAIRNPDIRKN